ncbi:MAG: DUF6262 family protein [Prochloraceae cyanobacterium]|nr:DUF6262 family protein [Prochloraceae cyanobacterium]
MKGKEQRIAKLNDVQQQRKQDCIDRTEKAIFKLLKSNERISFGAIAREANVSLSYLYKYPEIKERIQEIRDKQLREARKLTRPQTASEKSKQVIIQQLRERIQVLEYEKNEYKRQNEKMAGQLYQVGIKLDLFDQAKEETIRQAQEIKALKAELKLSKNKLADCQARLNENDSKVTPIKKKIQYSTLLPKIDNEIKIRLSNIGVQLNARLKKIIESKSQQEIDNAISAVEEYLDTNKKVKSKAGLLRTAIEESWIPNLTDEERKIRQVKDTFAEWFNLAKEQGIVEFSRGTEKGIEVMKSNGEWTSLEAMIEKGWTLEYLKERNKD